MSMPKTPLQSKIHNENAITDILPNLLKPLEENKKKNDRALQNLLPNALRGKRFYPTKARPVLQSKKSNNETTRPPVQKEPTSTEYKDISTDTVPQRKTTVKAKSTFTVYRDEYKDEHKNRRSCTKLKSTFASRKLSNHTTFGTDLFSTTDTPVYTLPNDCLLTIFKLCGDFENYCTLLNVCRRWRALASQPFLWKHIHSEWVNFNKKISFLHQPNQTFQQLQYIQKLTITNNIRITICNPMLDFAKIAPPVQLKELNLIHMNITDIVYLTSWLQNITVLRCKNTQISAKFYMTAFVRLDYLKTLEIHFERPCALNYHQISLGSGSSLGSPRRLPKTIQTFSLINIYDTEEYLDRRLHPIYNDTSVYPLNLENMDSINSDWLALEHNIVMKYRILTSLCNLRSLTLGQVSSFTARVWRECLIPCGMHLEYLSMKRWKGLGRRESPQSLANRRLQRDDTLMDGVETALSEFISSLKHIKKIQLDNFQCGPGLVQGITKLDKKYTIDTPYKQDKNDKISHYSDKLLDHCLIYFTSNVE